MTTLTGTATNWSGCRASNHKEAKKINTAHVLSDVINVFFCILIGSLLGAWLAIGNDELEAMIIAWKAGIL